MKNIFIIILFVTGILSCTSEDNVFEQSADERINAALTSYQKQLADAPFGWKALVYPGAGGVFSFYMNFNDQNRVMMYSDFSNETALTAKESSYRLKAIQTPSLIFDTYSYLHLLADPDGNINGGNNGEGLLSDYEFAFESAADNTENITLRGTKNQTKLILVKATQEESAAYKKGDLAKSFLFNNISKYQTYFKRMTIGGVVYEINVNQSARTITLNWLVGSTVNTFVTEYYYTSKGVVFLTPFVNGPQNVTGFADILWNESQSSLSFNAGGSVTTVMEASKPLKVDSDAPKRWYNTALNQDTYWITFDGFRVNGVNDAFNLNALSTDSTQYYFYLFWPGYGADYDGLGPVFIQNNALALFYLDAASAPTFTSDGRVVFKQLGTVGTYPKSGPALATRDYFYGTSGFYLIQVGERSYDMVSAKDAKGWVQWELP